MFKVNHTDGKARVGLLSTTHGDVDTPNFMPVGTQGTVKGLSPQRIRECGAQIILANTYHLHLRPGDELIRDLGGLHQFMGWDRPILTDSGGFQVFSLAKLRDIDDKGVTFKSHIDGSPVVFTPERVVEIQRNLGVDIMMVLDECPPYPADKEMIAHSMKRTYEWALRALDTERAAGQQIFAIVQGGVFEDLRASAVETLSVLPFDGFAIGGVSVGEPVAEMRKIAENTAPLLPDEKIRYLMGVGTPQDIVHAVSQGIDLFDCVIPTRSARFGRLYIENAHLNIRNSRFRTDPAPIMEGCDCYTCVNFSRAYLSHLVRAQEALAIELATIHNVRFYERLMEEIRRAIRGNCLEDLAERYLGSENVN